MLPLHLSSMSGVRLLLATNKPLIILLLSVKKNNFSVYFPFFFSSLNWELKEGSGNRQIYLGNL